MAAVKTLGTDDPVETSVSTTKGSRESCTITIEGLYEDLEDISSFSSYVPTGYDLDSHTLEATGDGLGRITLNCVSYNVGSASGWAALRTTFRVEMCETILDLITHEHVAGDVQVLSAWLATDAMERVGGEDDFRYRAGTRLSSYDTQVEGSEEGETGSETYLFTIGSQTAIDFCNAYQKGVTTYVRYDPVIEKQSIWKNPPGITRDGISFTGGSLGSSAFSANVGKFDTPPITLNGFASTNYFKSKDSWVENADRTWTRTEQWTYTPDGPNSDVGWVYAASSNSNSSGGSSS